MNGITMDQWLKMVPDSVVNLPEGLRNLLFQLYQTFIAADRWKWFLNGLKITFAVTIGALILGVIIGLLIAVVRTAHDSRRMGKKQHYSEHSQRSLQAVSDRHPRYAYDGSAADHGLCYHGA